MSIGIIIIGLDAAFLAFRFVAGMVKFVVLAAIVIAVAYFLMHGGLG